MQMGKAKLIGELLSSMNINHKDFEEAVKFIGGRYVQHNPLIADGPQGLKAFLSFLKASFPKLRGEIKNVFADGDYVGW